MIGQAFDPKHPETIDLSLDPRYRELTNVMGRAYDQATQGKGAERHAQGLAFTDQPMQVIQGLVGPGFALGQAIKKVQEASRMPTDRAVHELLGAINYIAGAIVYLERNIEVVE